jgi:hypothetical protein
MQSYLSITYIFLILPLKLYKRNIINFFKIFKIIFILKNKIKLFIKMKKSKIK